MAMTCQACASTGFHEWTSPPHRDDPRYRYSCTACSGTGDENLLSFELTPLGRELIDNPPRGGNAPWIKERPDGPG
jgi:hypothetical protein